VTVGRPVPYTLSGHGDHHVIAFHGWLSASDGWEAMLPYLDPSQATWCLLDAPGYGAARAVPEARDIHGYAASALRVLDELGWDEVTAVGHSMGGVGIQRLLAAAPGRVTRLIGVAAVPASGAGLQGERLAMFERAVGELDGAAALLSGSTGGRHPQAWSAALAERAFRATEPAVRASYLASWADVDFHREVQGIDVPVDLVVGEFDPSLTEDRMRSTWCRWFPRSAVRTMEGVGHYPPDEAPEAFAALLGDLLRGPGGVP
jgi:pimeloyl-ACP methyl ester carboxylesterase